MTTIDPDKGALHEVGGRLELGPPKSKAGVRTVHLPQFLVDLLTEHRAGRMQDHVFTGLDGGLLRRSNFRRRVWLPLVTGDPTRGWAPIRPGLHFHDLRHTHKTWLIEDGGVTTYGVDDHVKIVCSNLLPRQQNSPSVVITDGLSDLRL